jgi:hypothetical protein
MKPATPRAPLWVLIVATEVLDLVSFGLMALGVERGGEDPSFPWSHGLLMSLVWSAVAAGIGFLLYRDRRAAAVVGLTVFSHWVFDFVSHPPHLPLLFEGSPRVGLGLETSVPVGVVMEFSLLAAGISIYLAARKRKANTRSTA